MLECQIPLSAVPYLFFDTYILPTIEEVMNSSTQIAADNGQYPSPASELTIDASAEFNQTDEHDHRPGRQCRICEIDIPAEDAEKLRAACDVGDAEFQSIMDGDDLTREDLSRPVPTVCTSVGSPHVSKGHAVENERPPTDIELRQIAWLKRDLAAEKRAHEIASIELIHQSQQLADERRRRQEFGLRLNDAERSSKDYNERLALAAKRTAELEQFAGAFAKHWDELHADFEFITGKSVEQFLAAQHVGCKCGHRKSDHADPNGSGYHCFKCDCGQFEQGSKIADGILAFSPANRDDSRMCTCGCVLAVHTRTGIHHARGCSTHAECTNFTEFRDAA